MFNDHDQMREFILLSEHLDYRPAPLVESEEPVIEENLRHPIMDDLGDLVFRLRSLMESGGPDALGIEMGMRRAADMIENLINRHEGSDIGSQI